MAFGEDVATESYTHTYIHTNTCIFEHFSVIFSWLLVKMLQLNHYEKEHCVVILAVSMHACMYVCICVHTRMYVYTHVCVYIYIYMNVYICMYETCLCMQLDHYEREHCVVIFAVSMYVCMYVCMCLYMYAHTHVCVYSRVCVCVCVYIYIYIYMHIYKCLYMCT